MPVPFVSAVANPVNPSDLESAFTPGQDPAPVPFWDAVGATAANDYANGRLNGREDLLNSAYLARHADVEQRIGQSFAFAPAPTDADTPYSLNIQAFEAAGGDEADIDRFRQQFPQKMAGVPTKAQLQAQVDARLNAVAQRAGLAAQAHPVGGFIGGAAGQLLDPMNTAVGAATGGVGDGLPLALRIAAQSAVWGGLAGVEAPFKAAEASQVGGPAYGLPEAAGDVLSGLAAGPFFEGGGALLKGALRPITSRLFGAAEPVLTPEAEAAVSGAFAADPVARGAVMTIDRGLRDSAAIGPLRDGSDFDAGLYSLQTGAAPPAIEPNADVGDLFANPRPPDPVAAPAMPQDATTAPGARIYDGTQYRGRPIYAASFDPAQMQTAPDVFQYKSGGDAAGVTDRLRGVATWDPASSGKAIGYQADDGSLFIADGHQRLALAQRLIRQGLPASMDGLLFRSADGWSPGEVRTIAALKNVREGQGTPLDAAKVFRDAPAAMNDDSLPVSGDFMRQAKGLARLSPEAFGAVVNDVIPQNQAALIGELAAARPDLHEPLVGLLHAGEPSNLDEAHAMIHEALLDDWVRQQGAQSDLFGDTPTQSLAIGRARLRAWLVKSLRGDTRLFGQLVKHADAIEAGGNTLARDANEAALATNQTALELIAKLGMRTGEIGDAMTAASREISDGTRVADAAKGVLARLRRALNAGERLDLGRAKMLDPEPPSEGAEKLADLFSEPAGKGQAEQLVPKPEESGAGEEPPRPRIETHTTIEINGVKRELHIMPTADDIADLANEGDEAETAALAELKDCAP